jgi:hypothetical protein
MTKTAAIEGTAILETDFRDALLRRGVPLKPMDYTLPAYVFKRLSGKGLRQLVLL